MSAEVRMGLRHGIDEVHGVPDSPREARHAVGALMREPAGPYSGEAHTDAAMAVGELVAHALQHTPGISRFAAFAHDGLLDLTIDYRDGPPADFQHSGAATLRWTVVSALATSVTFTRPHGRGHRVRVLLHLR
ncbi:hypothetical protein ACN2WE_33015 [Streptomyces sp. cg28]|uniref:hypothetical protein n=1 Tax=Streptomyces sp. cg28 TaxID=3403457 RepID=UPI003B2189A2